MEEPGQSCECNGSPHLIYKFKIPTLPAYAIEHSSLVLSGGNTFLLNETNLLGDQLIVHTAKNTCLENYDCELIIYFHGIRNYSMLFPWVEDDVLRDRLGRFYEESEAAFENAAWLSFILMCGAIFEGMLFAKIAENLSFNQLIIRAKEEEYIDEYTANIMNRVRTDRNLVHANRCAEPFASRMDAMDTRTVLDRLIKDA